MKTLVIDTETTGLFTKANELDVEQPWPVQLAVIVLDDQLQVTAQVNALIIPPEGAVWTEKAMQMHGINPAVVAANGRPAAEVLGELRDLAADADCIAAYNLPYDERVVRTSGMRLGLGPIFPQPSETVEHLCIMEWASWKLGARYRLAQAYKQLTGKRIENAHDAFADTLAAVEVLQHIYADPRIVRD